jgi:hypothetical protein
MRENITMSDEKADAVTGKLSEALEYIERARGHLYSFHQLTGHADLLLDEVVEAADEAGVGEVSALVRREIYGRNVLEGRWTFEVVDEFDAGYYAAWRDVESRVRQLLADGEKHRYERALKAERQAKGVNAKASDA